MDYIQLSLLPLDDYESVIEPIELLSEDPPQPTSVESNDQLVLSGYEDLV